MFGLTFPTPCILIVDSECCLPVHVRGRAILFKVQYHSGVQQSLRVCRGLDLLLLVSMVSSRSRQPPGRMDGYSDSPVFQALGSWLVGFLRSFFLSFSSSLIR